MKHCFILPEQIKQHKVVLSGSEAVYVTRVLRLRPGDALIVSDGQGKSYRIRLSRLTKEVEGVIEEEIFFNAEPSVQITLVQSLPKSDKMEMIIQKCTELGVQEIIPLKANRSIIKLTGEKLKQRVQRWERVAIEAAKQCQRVKVPRVSEPMFLENILTAMPPQAKGIMPWEEERRVSFRQVLKKTKEKKIFLFIGPEGGFEQKEVTLAKKYNVVTVSLGKRILRTETAALATVTMILYEFGDLGEWV
jgi:16S rRNA (uracil1498-N3)-methyltransferase